MGHKDIITAALPDAYANVGNAGHLSASMLATLMTCERTNAGTLVGWGVTACHSGAAAAWWFPNPGRVVSSRAQLQRRQQHLEYGRCRDVSNLDPFQPITIDRIVMFLTGERCLITCVIWNTPRTFTLNTLSQAWQKVNVCMRAQSVILMADFHALVFPYHHHHHYRILDHDQQHHLS